MKYKFWSLILLGGILFSSSISANVVMTGTRVILPSSQTEKIIQFSNPDPQPYVVQVKITDDKGRSNEDIPFILVPPIFRMEGQTGQSVRMIVNNAHALPQNRESVFYMSFTQLPALKASQQGNSLILAITSRVKVFYRPKSLIGKQNDAYKSLSFSSENGVLLIDNPTGYYINIKKSELVMDGHDIQMTGGIMLPPQSVTKQPYSIKMKSLKGRVVKLTVINDYGADVEVEKRI